MKEEMNRDLFDPRTMIEPEYEGSSREGNFGFAFNDSNFSDRILRIEIMAGPSDSFSDCAAAGDGCSAGGDWAHHRKRRRENMKKDNDDNNNNLNNDIMNDNFSLINNEVDANPPDDNDQIDGQDVAVFAEEQVLNQSDADEVLGGENDDEEAVAMIEEPVSGDDGVNSNDSSWSMECTPILRVQTLHISSPILAAKSPFFYKLFSNGMKESEQRQVTLRIHESEETALMELLNFMYSNTLSANTPTAVLDVLMAADKFEVGSCMRYCSRMLRNMPMTPESALLYLDLPSTVLMASAVQPLTDAAKQYLADRYKDITKFQEELMSLPISGIEAVLSSDDLQVASEDAVYDFVLKWARARYPKLEERREILATRLARFIRFPYMTCRKLKKALTCPDIDNDLSSKLVMEALFFKAEAPHRQRTLVAEEPLSTKRRFMERTYKYRPVKVVEFDLPCQQCVVYLDLKREECANLFPSGRVYSQAFHLGGQGFFLSAHCNMDQQSSFHCFGLFLGMQEKGSVSFAVDYEFAARSMPTEDFQSKYKGNYTFTGGKAVGYRNLFGIPWTSFMADDSLYFINGVLHLRAELTIRK